jgi:hypothetical protein
MLSSLETKAAGCGVLSQPVCTGRTGVRQTVAPPQHRLAFRSETQALRESGSMTHENRPGPRFSLKCREVDQGVGVTVLNLNGPLRLV